MGKTKLTDTVVKRLPLPPEGRSNVVHYDDGLAGFGVRITRAGSRAFIFNYRVKRSGVERRLTIGATTAWTVSAARERARELRRIVDSGGDPQGDLDTHRQAATVIELAERYKAEHLPRKRSRSDDESLLRQWVMPELGQRKVADLKRDDIVRLHAKITAAGTPTRANRALSLVSMLLSLGVEWGIVEANVARGIRRNKEHRRSRYLSGEELARFMAALAAHDNKEAAAALKLLLLTGARRGELLKARWDDIDLRAGAWRKPAATTKSGREHIVPLSTVAQSLLVAMRTRADGGDEEAVALEDEARRCGRQRERLQLQRLAAAARARKASPFVFPDNDGKAGLHLRYTWRGACKAAGLEGLRLHDLRHSAASFWVSGGESLPLVGAMLGHASPSMTARYAHLHNEPQRRAAERLGEIVQAAERGTTAEVLPLERRPNSR